VKCLIVDDEQLARALLEKYVSQIPDLELVAACRNGIEATKMLHEHSIDLLITDIQMPGLLGTEMVKALNYQPMVIFTTAHRDYAIEGFELEALDYLLKPFPFDRFLAAVNKAFARHSKAGTAHSFDLKSTYLTIKADHKLYKVQYSDIRYIEGMREYVSFYVPSGRITALFALKSLEEDLPREIFIRCHKSYIVNKRMVETLEGNNLSIQGKLIPIGQSYKEQVLKEVF